jgi:hypothetical protein
MWECGKGQCSCRTGSQRLRAAASSRPELATMLRPACRRTSAQEECMSPPDSKHRLPGHGGGPVRRSFTGLSSWSRPEPAACWLLVPCRSRPRQRASCAPQSPAACYVRLPVGGPCNVEVVHSSKLSVRQTPQPSGACYLLAEPAARGFVISILFLSK